MIEIKSKTVVSHVEPSEIQNREVLPNVLARTDKVIKYPKNAEHGCWFYQL